MALGFLLKVKLQIVGSDLTQKTLSFHGTSGNDKLVEMKEKIFMYIKADAGKSQLQVKFQSGYCKNRLNF